MRHRKELDFIIELLKSAVTDYNPLFPKYDLDWEFIFQLALHHKIMSTLYFGMLKLPKEQQKKIGHFENYVLEYKKNLVLDANRIFELERLQPILEKNNIDYIFLKGSVLKYLYPDTAMRRMNDIDILFRNTNFDVLDDIFLKLGYKILHKDAKDTAYFNPVNKVKIEMQPHLIDKGYTDWYEYLEQIWEKCDLSSKKMADEDFYIYHIIHMAKHFINGGIGLTHVLDVYMMMQNYTNLNHEYIKTELSLLRLSKFNHNIRMLVRYWFEDAKFQDEDSDTVKLMEKYIFMSGAFGVNAQKELNAAAIRGDAKVSLRKKLFPNLKTMINYYGNSLDKHHCLLPIYWAKLNFQRLCKGRKKILQGVNHIYGTTQQQLDETKDILKRCGL